MDRNRTRWYSVTEKTSRSIDMTLTKGQAKIYCLYCSKNILDKTEINKCFTYLYNPVQHTLLSNIVVVCNSPSCVDASGIANPPPSFDNITQKLRNNLATHYSSLPPLFRFDNEIASGTAMTLPEIDEEKNRLEREIARARSSLRVMKEANEQVTRDLYHESANQRSTYSRLTREIEAFTPSVTRLEEGVASRKATIEKSQKYLKDTQSTVNILKGEIDRADQERLRLSLVLAEKKKGVAAQNCEIVRASASTDVHWNRCNFCYSKNSSHILSGCGHTICMDCTRERNTAKGVMNLYVHCTSCVRGSYLLQIRD